MRWSHLIKMLYSDWIKINSYDITVLPLVIFQMTTAITAITDDYSCLLVFTQKVNLHSNRSISKLAKMK